MSRINFYAFVTLVLAAIVPAEANAFSCLKGHQPFKLSGDSIEYSMAISPGADCIQGLRWSFMQVYAVWPMKKPANGQLVMVGTGFRYYAKPGFTGTDKFTLLVVGKNRHEEGYSTVEITVSPQDAAKVATAGEPDSASAPAAKLAAATAIQ
jgi:hypothetical protein